MKPDALGNVWANDGDPKNNAFTWMDWMNDATNHRSYWGNTPAAPQLDIDNRYTYNTIAANGIFSRLGGGPPTPALRSDYVYPNTTRPLPTKVKADDESTATMVVGSCVLKAGDDTISFVRVGKDAYFRAPVATTGDFVQPVTLKPDQNNAPRSASYNFETYLKYCARELAAKNYFYTTDQSNQDPAQQHRIPAEWLKISRKAADVANNPDLGKDQSSMWMITVNVEIPNDGTTRHLYCGNTQIADVTALNDAIHAAGTGNNNAQAPKIDGSFYANGQSYFFTTVQQNGFTGQTDALAGVIRNHIYNITVMGLTGLGTPVIDPDMPINPDTPGEDDETPSYLSAKINILQWRVVNQGAVLE